MRFYSSAIVFLIPVLMIALSVSGCSQQKEKPAQKTIILSSTTSIDNSGLYDFLLPVFTRDTGITVRVIAVGTGRALDIASRGDADVLIVHDEPSELAFMREGHGIDRKTFMFNDYVLVGPMTDGIVIKEADTVDKVLKRILESGVTFISRGDDSGTHKKEQSLWYMTIGSVPVAQHWYREVGRGMGATLNIANELGAYTLSDRATWVSFNNRENLRVILENEPPLHNPYSVILVNSAAHPNVHFQESSIFVDWLTSEKSLSLIRSFKVRGEQIFFTF